MEEKIKKEVYEFNKGCWIYLDNKHKCNFLQRVILINSIMYYELNTTKMSDKKFDSVCKQLLNLKKQTSNYKQTEYYFVFKDFDGSTGFDLYHRLNKKDKKYLLNITNFILKGGTSK